MLGLYIALIVIFALLVIHFTMVYLIFIRFFKRTSLRRIDKSFSHTSYSKPYAKKIIEIRNKMIKEKKYEIKQITSYDGLKLSAYYFDAKSDKTMILVHGLRTHAFNNFALAINYFLARNYNILAINQRAHEGSEGKYVAYGQKEYRDVLSWVSYVSNDNNIEEIYLYGISMGATSVALASEHLTSSKIKYLIIEDGYTSIKALVDHIVSSQHIPAFFFLGGVNFLSKHIANVDWNISSINALKNNNIPTIFVHGTKDVVATKEFFLDNYNNCASNKYQIVVDGAPHALCAYYDNNYLDKLNKILGEKND